MTIGQSDSGTQDAGRRELVDTREPGGPEGRTYSVPFADVWDLVAAEVRSQRGWELVYADEERGLFTVVCRSRLPRGTDDLSVWVRLDENGLTRVDARSGTREGRRPPGGNLRRVAGLLKSLDDALGPGCRVVR